MMRAVMVAFGLLACTAVSARAQVKGMIISRAGDTIVVKGDQGTTQVALTDHTDTKDDTGLFGLGKEHLDDTVLIPGLKVKVEGAPDSSGKFVASVITVDGDDMETAEMVQAGLHPTAQQVAANVKNIEAHEAKLGEHSQAIQAAHQNIKINEQNIATNKAAIDDNIKDIEANTNRFQTLDDYDVKGSATVKFKVGSSRIATADEDQLKQLAQSALGMQGVLIEVMGYADATGGAEMNTALSERRAKSVINFLVQQCNVPIRFIVAPGAMGEYGAAAPNETSAGRAENRRVEVKVLANKGVNGSGL
ncbi:MAG TPA: OmpA family protein [Terracidiphilus sp.]|nr:OmpA family protein [Terracidiphilus sp.]